MPITIGKNISALKAQQQLSRNNLALSTAYERLSSGMRINRAADDPAGLAMAMSLDATSRIYSRAIRNVNDGISVANVASAALSSARGILERLSELAEQSANGVYSGTQRNALSQEASALVSEYNRILASASFNGSQLFDPSSGDLTIQGGIGTNAQTSVNLKLGLLSDVGDGTFGAVSTVTSVGFHNMVDFDGDGILDMLGVQISTIRFVKGLGDGLFAPQVSLGSSGGPLSHDSRTADVNGDGNADVISGDSNGRIYVRLGDGTGGFIAASSSYDSGLANIDAIQLADFNADGVLDVVFQGSKGTSEVGVFLGNGDGSFRAAQTFAIPVDTGLTVADFNNDGRADIGTGKAVYLSNASGGFGAASMTDTEVLLTAGDFNGDGNQDLVMYGTVAKIRLGNGDGTFASGITIPGATGLGTELPFSSIDRALSADVNRDGYDDLALEIGTQSEVRVYMSNGDGTFSIGSTVAIDAGGYLWRFQDIDGDDVPDVDVILYGTGEDNYYLANTTTSTNLLGVNISTQSAARTTLTTLSTAMENLSLAEQNIGVFQSRLEIQQGFMTKISDEFAAAASRIRDADVAEESANLVRAKIRQEAAVAVMSHAKLDADIVLKLLGA